MNMTLGELMGCLTELQKVAGPNTSTNVDAVKVKGTIELDYGTAGAYSYNRNAERKLGLSIWLEGFVDGPSQQAQDLVS